MWVSIVEEGEHKLSSWFRIYTFDFERTCVDRMSCLCTLDQGAVKGRLHTSLVNTLNPALTKKTGTLYILKAIGLLIY